MGEYYYLMAQLPYLMYDKKPPMSSEKFKELASSQLNKADASFLEHLSLDIEGYADTSDSDSSENTMGAYSGPQGETYATGCDFVDRWNDWERTLRLNLARHRSLKLYPNKTYTIDPPVVPDDAYAAAALVFTQDGSPLDGELLLDKARWNAIDLMTGNDYFHENNVYAYYLKLLILERRELFDAEKGFAEYKSLYAQIFERSHNRQQES